MTGIDEESALLKKVRAHLCVKWKKLTDSQKLTAEEEYFLKYGGRNLAFAQVVN